MERLTNEVLRWSLDNSQISKGFDEKSGHNKIRPFKSNEMKEGHNSGEMQMSAYLKQDGEADKKSDESMFRFSKQSDYDERCYMWNKKAGLPSRGSNEFTPRIIFN